MLLMLPGALASLSVLAFAVLFVAPSAYTLLYTRHRRRISKNLRRYHLHTLEESLKA